MPQQSKYSNAQFEALLSEVCAVFEKQEVTADLSLMVLGNAVTHLLHTRVPESMREELAEKFSQALLKSVK
ncbi:MAG: DUF1414 domain-containing protein [Aestuariibacter sp.]